MSDTDSSACAGGSLRQVDLLTNTAAQKKARRPDAPGVSLKLMTPEERKAYKKAYDATPERRAAKAAYRALPEVKAYMVVKNKKYREENLASLKADSKKKYHETKDAKRELKAISSKAYRERNKEKIKESQRIARQANEGQRECAIERSRQWYLANKDKAIESTKSYYLNNKERIVVGIAAYKKANPEVMRLSGRICRLRRRSRLLEAGGEFTKIDIERLHRLQQGRCANCHISLDGGYHIDHRIPVAKGGSDHPHNLELLCPTCNTKKQAKWPHEFAQENGRLL